MAKKPADKSEKVEQPVKEETPMSNTEIVPVETSSAIVPENALVRKYQEGLPHLKNYLDAVKPVEPDELMNAVARLPDAQKAAFIELLARMNPQKLGQHTQARRFNLPDLRMYHGTGNDEMRPADCPAGGIYGSDGKLLAAPKEALNTLRFNPKYKDLRETVTCFVVGFHSAGTFWPPRNGPMPEGVEVRPNTPICRTIDRKKGSYFGDCPSCPFRPFKDNKPQKDACTNEDHVYVLLADGSGLYRAVFKSTSIAVGSRVIAKVSNSWRTYWEHPFELEAKAQSKGTNRWFELNASLSAAPDPTPEFDEVLRVVARNVDYEIYFPQLYSIYTTEPRMATAAPVSDMTALLAQVPGAAETAEAKKDVSTNNF